MVPLIVIVVAVIIAAAVWWLYLQQAGESGAGQASVPPREFGRLLKEEREFHIEGATAKVVFDVPIAADTADPALRDLMLGQGVEVLRKKRAHGLPIEGITTIVVYGMRDGAPVEVGRADVEDVHAPAPIDPPVPPPHASTVPYDPLEQLAELEPAAPPSVAARTKGDELAPIGKELRFTASLEETLRARGIDVDTAPMSEIVLGLLERAGYTLTPGSKPGTYVAVLNGRRTFLQLIDHEPGSYPELDESAINQFLYAFMDSGAERGMLFTDKFSPFLVYDKERREPRIRFITRERLQSFVDSVAMG